MPQTYEQQHNLDGYGYPLPPDSRTRLRKRSIRASKSFLGILLFLVMSIIGGLLWLGRWGGKYSSLATNTIHPQRILAIRLDLIGDLVLSMTTVRSLKRSFPEAKIDLLALPVSAKVVMGDPDLNEILTYDPNVWRRPKALFHVKNWRNAYKLLHHLRTQNYDIAVSIFGKWAGILAALSGAKRRVGYGRESYPGLMTKSVSGRHWKPGDHKHEVDYCLALAKAAGANTSEADRIPRLYVDPLVQQQLEQLLTQAGITQEKLLIACHVSSNNGQSKRWPIPHWATLIDKLVRELDAQVVLTGAPNDKPLVESVIGKVQEQAIDLAGKTSLPQLVALLQKADLVISGDSGPMHIAAAVGTPLIAIHGPTDPALSGPISPTVTVLRSEIWCSPCYNATGTADCRFFTTQCMKNVLPSQVFKVVQAKLT